MLFTAYHFTSQKHYFHMQIYLKMMYAGYSCLIYRMNLNSVITAITAFGEYQGDLLDCT